MTNNAFTIGKVTLYKEQAYTLVATEPYRRQRDGSETTLLVWQTNRAECGQPFVTKTPRKKNLAFTRRCPEHASPGVRVET